MCRMAQAPRHRVSGKTYRLLSGWDFHPLVICAVEAHCPVKRDGHGPLPVPTHRHASILRTSTADETFLSATDAPPVLSELASAAFFRSAFPPN
jgi:hypothetical protein